MRRLEIITTTLLRAGALLALLLAFGGVSGACFTEPDPKCAFACSSSGGCADGYRCTKDGWCKRNDVPGDFQCSPASLIDGATFDSARSDADTTDADTPDAMPGT